MSECGGGEQKRREVKEEARNPSNFLLEVAGSANKRKQVLAAISLPDRFKQSRVFPATRLINRALTWNTSYQKFYCNQRKLFAENRNGCLQFSSVRSAEGNP